MKKRNDQKVIFKPYHQNQLMVLPPSIEELIASGHPVRVINDVLNKIDASELLGQYKPGGTSSYHPVMLLKVLVYGYINNIYSSRRLEEAVQQNIHFMWLAGMSKPDHNTINRFRSERLKDSLKKIFVQVVKLLAEEGLLSIKEVYTDGTKIEANANRYSFVWGKAIRTSKERMKRQLDELWQYAQSIAADELEDPDPDGFDQISPEKVKQTIEAIDAALKDKPVSKTVKQKLNYAKKRWPSVLSKYEEQEKILGEGRSSFSKSDPDATFMRMKEDHMKNGQLKPGYNLQISTNNQYIANYTVHCDTNDTNTLIPHLEEFKKQFEQLPEVVCADAGYGSEENYQYLDQNKVESYVKYAQFDREQNETIRNKKPFSTDTLYYNEKEDCFICPMGQRMKKIKTFTKKSHSGFRQTISSYQAQNCEGCPLRGVCHNAQGNRAIQINHKLNQLKQHNREKLLSEKGVYHRKKRCADVEPVFANIKHNHGHKRFLLRGKGKVNIEVGLLALAHNLRKKAA